MIHSSHDSLAGYLRDLGFASRRDPDWSCDLTVKGCVIRRLGREDPSEMGEKSHMFMEVFGNLCLVCLQVDLDVDFRSDELRVGLLKKNGRRSEVGGLVSCRLRVSLGVLPSYSCRLSRDILVIKSHLHNTPSLFLYGYWSSVWSASTQPGRLARIVAIMVPEELEVFAHTGGDRTPDCGREWGHRDTRGSTYVTGERKLQSRNGQVKRGKGRKKNSSTSRLRTFGVSKSVEL